MSSSLSVRTGHFTVYERTYPFGTPRTYNSGMWGSTTYREELVIPNSELEQVEIMSYLNQYRPVDKSKHRNNNGTYNVLEG